MARKISKPNKQISVSAIVLGLLLTACTQAQQPVGAEQGAIHIPVQHAEPIHTQQAAYHCTGSGSLLAHIGPETTQVRYINAGAISLVVLPVDGQTQVFSNVIAASGAKYVAGEFVWWTKGSTAFFSSALLNNTGTLTCQETKPDTTHP